MQSWPEEKFMKLSDIRKFNDGMSLSKEDAANILDALNEWDDSIGAKELDDDEVGLDYQRWVELKLRLMNFVEEKELVICDKKLNEKQGQVTAKFNDIK